MNAVLSRLLTCVAGACRGPLRPRHRGALLGCTRCPAIYPVLAGVPIVVPSPTTYLASYRDAVLATLAEADLVTGPALTLIDEFARAGGPAEALGFGDDWTAAEADAPRPAAATDDVAIAAWLAAAPDPATTIAALVPPTARLVVEIGCGGNALAARLRARGRTVIVTDRSLRAVVRTCAATGAVGAVVEAEALPFVDGAIDALIAANLVDLLDAPDAFVAGAAAALAHAGVAIVSTPDPGLGTGDPDRLTDLLADAGLTVAARHPGQPWLRAHSPRHYQLYFADVLVAGRAAISARGRGRGRAPGRDRDRGRGRGRSPGRAGARPPSS
ncbi:MAG: methyltransferase domain-containing protein [Myxococcales bacterium]|nr:methyltransferase domain-containing protein [Myxococcales bacterium]